MSAIFISHSSRDASVSKEVMERLFEGQPHEMVTMYHLDGDELVLTHYCAMGNQPHMALQSESTAERLVFDFVSGGNMASTNDMHMHSGAIRFLNTNQLEAFWDVFQTDTYQRIIDYVMDVMTRNRIRHLPIVADGRLAGILSIGDVVNALRGGLESENRYLRDYVQGIIA